MSKIGFVLAKRHGPALTYDGGQCRLESNGARAALARPTCSSSVSLEKINILYAQRLVDASIERGLGTGLSIAKYSNALYRKRRHSTIGYLSVRLIMISFDFKLLRGAA
jgi:hypothetical protein